MSLSGPNPYQPPALIADATTPLQTLKHRHWLHSFAWTILFFFNVYVSLWFALPLRHGNTGAAVATGLVYALGLLSCFYFDKKLVNPLLVGLAVVSIC